MEVLKRYQVKRVIYPEANFSSGVYDEWRRLIKEQAIEYTLAKARQRIDLGDGVV
ncbi:hypothetical protein ACFLTJ_02200, partial [Chloroflexota bacterium]